MILTANHIVHVLSANLDLLNHFGLIEDFQYSLKTHCFSGIIPYQKGVVKSLNQPKMLSQYKIEFLIKEGDVLEQSESLRDIGAKIVVYNQSFEDLYKDFNEMESYKFIDI